MQCIGVYDTLPHAPRHVSVLQDETHGVVIAAVSYSARATADAHDTRGHRHRRPRSTVTVAEFDVVRDAAAAVLSSADGSSSSDHNNNTRKTPTRVWHLAVPGVAVTAMTLLRRAPTHDVYVIVQCAQPQAAPHATQRDDGGRTATYVYRRVQEDCYADEHSDSRSEDDGDNDTTTSVVRYVRLPHVLRADNNDDDDNDENSDEDDNEGDDDDDARWTAVAPLCDGATGASATTLLLAAAVAGRNGRTAQMTRLQVWQLRATRLTRRLTICLPALSQLPVQRIVAVPGRPYAAVLLCHNALIEVDVQTHLAVTAAAATKVNTATTIVTAADTTPRVCVDDGVMRRVWRTRRHHAACGGGGYSCCCCTRDGFLLAGTDTGAMLVYDMRRTTHNNKRNNEDDDGDGNDDEECSSSNNSTCARGAATAQRSLLGQSADTGAAMVGVSAAYAARPLSCAVDGLVTAWRYDGNAATLVPAVQAGVTLCCGGANGCVAVASDDDVHAVVYEAGQLRLFRTA